MTNDGLYLDNLTLTYFRHPAVHHINCHIEKGSWTAILGPNGGGKSTLLKAMAGLRDINEGQIHWIGMDKNNIGYLGHPENLNRQIPISVYSLVAQGLWPKKKLWLWLEKSEKSKIEAALEQVDLLTSKDKSISELSPGQFQRALFARLILQNPELILLDEPFATLDPTSTSTLLKVCKKWHREGRTIIMIMHDLNLVKENVPQALILAKKLVRHGPSKSVLSVNWPHAMHLEPEFKNEICQEPM